MRVGRIGYINCYPVYGAIDRGLVPLAAELVTGTPSELNDLLAAGELDVSVVSAVEYARQARHYILLPDLAISCDGAVRHPDRPEASLPTATLLAILDGMPRRFPFGDAAVTVDGIDWAGDQFGLQNDPAPDDSPPVPGF